MASPAPPAAPARPVQPAQAPRARQRVQESLRGKRGASLSSPAQGTGTTRRRVPCATAALFADAAALVRVRRTAPRRDTGATQRPTAGEGASVSLLPLRPTDSESPLNARVSLPPATPPFSAVIAARATVAIPPFASAAADPATVLVLGFVDLALVPNRSCLFTNRSPAPIAHADGSAIVSIERGTPVAPRCIRMTSCTHRGDIASCTKMQWTVSLPLATPPVAPRRR